MHNLQESTIKYCTYYILRKTPARRDSLPYAKVAFHTSCRAKAVNKLAFIDMQEHH